VSLRDLGFWLRGRLNQGVSRLLHPGPPSPLPPPAPLDDVLRGADTPLALSRLVEARGNAEREAAVASFLAARGVPFTRHRFTTLEGGGENFAVEVGGGDRVLVLIAHHDAVPGSPGANDNGAALGILLHLLPRLERALPPGLRARLLFTAGEELGYLGARAYVKDTPLGDIGDALVLWDAAGETPFLRRATSALEALGRRRDDTYHVVGRIPVFGSDHRAFAAAGLPAYGLTIVPHAEAEPLRQFIFHPLRGALRHLARRPRPFDTYHTPRDTGATLEPAALDAVADALLAIAAEARA
jgi:hypothetical protein